LPNFEVTHQHRNTPDEDFIDDLRQAHLSPTRSTINIPIEELLQNVEEVWVKLGKQPTYNDMDGPLSLFSAGTYANRFDSWSAALDAFAASVAASASSEEPLEQRVPITPLPTTAKTNSRHINWLSRFKVLQRDHFTCVSCGRSPAKDPSVELHLDHIVAWSNGGASTMDNLQTLCSVCNIGKSNLEA
jgi:hypothetical protein